MGQAPIRHPRFLKKHPGPVKEDALLEELKGKGFVQIKRGQHDLTGAKEDSDIYLRRQVGSDGRHYFETIRVDRKASRSFTPTQADLAKSRGQIQSEAKPFRRAHHTIEETSSQVPGAEGGNLKTDMKQMLAQLEQGARKGTFSHWHHERFLATPENLGAYLQGPISGAQKLDPVGEVLR
jgi:hypothetical protein